MLHERGPVYLSLSLSSVDSLVSGFNPLSSVFLPPTHSLLGVGRLNDLNVTTCNQELSRRNLFEYTIEVALLPRDSGKAAAKLQVSRPLDALGGNIRLREGPKHTGGYDSSRTGKPLLLRGWARIY